MPRVAEGRRQPPQGILKRSALQSPEKRVRFDVEPLPSEAPDAPPTQTQIKRTQAAAMRRRRRARLMAMQDPEYVALREAALAKDPADTNVVVSPSALVRPRPTGTPKSRARRLQQMAAAKEVSSTETTRRNLFHSVSHDNNNDDLRARCIALLEMSREAALPDDDVDDAEEQPGNGVHSSPAERVADSDAAEPNRLAAVDALCSSATVSLGMVAATTDEDDTHGDFVDMIMDTDSGDERQGPDDAASNPNYCESIEPTDRMAVEASGDTAVEIDSVVKDMRPDDAANDDHAKAPCDLEPLRSDDTTMAIEASGDITVAGSGRDDSAASVTVAGDGVVTDRRQSVLMGPEDTLAVDDVTKPDDRGAHPTCAAVQSLSGNAVDGRSEVDSVGVEDEGAPAGCTGVEDRDDTDLDRQGNLDDDQDNAPDYDVSSQAGARVGSVGASHDGITGQDPVGAFTGQFKALSPEDQQLAMKACMAILSSRHEKSAQAVKPARELRSPLWLPRSDGENEGIWCLDGAFNDDDETAVERIVAVRMDESGAQFRIRWEGYASDHDSWVPEDGITAGLDAMLKTFNASSSSRVQLKVSPAPKPKAAPSISLDAGQVVGVLANDEEAVAGDRFWLFELTKPYVGSLSDTRVNIEGFYLTRDTRDDARTLYRRRRTRKTTNKISMENVLCDRAGRIIFPTVAPASKHSRRLDRRDFRALQASANVALR
ncbi:Chromo domain-containing protein [Plasmodiophora brassicae]